MRVHCDKYIFPSFGMASQSETLGAHGIIEQAIDRSLPATDTVIVEEAKVIGKKMFEQVKKGNYPEAIAITLKGLEQFPHNFELQSDLASLLGDTSEITPSPLKEKMLSKAKELFNKLEKEAANQPKETYYPFKNEFYFRAGMYKEQYELGLEIVTHFWQKENWKPLGINGYYYQGVGAARYARKLIEQGNKALAIDYAQKAMVSWAQYFSYENTYYNSYVHYALALGILGHKEEMMRALTRSASMLQRGFDYFEFKEVIDSVNGLDAAH